MRVRGIGDGWALPLFRALAGQGVRPSSVTNGESLPASTSMAVFDSSGIVCTAGVNASL